MIEVMKTLNEENLRTNYLRERYIEVNKGESIKGKNERKVTSESFDFDKLMKITKSKIELDIKL